MSVFYIFLYFVLTKILAISLNHYEICLPNHIVIKELINRYSVILTNPKLQISYSLQNLHANNVDDFKAKLLLNTSNILFTGRIDLKKSENIQKNMKITFSTKPIVIQLLSREIYNGIERTCSMGTSENIELKIGLPTEVEATLIQLSEFCIKEHICNNFNSLISSKLVKKKTHKFFSFLQIIKESLRSSKEETKDNKSKKNIFSCITGRNGKIDPKCKNTYMYDPQPTINSMIDFGLGHLSKQFNNGVVNIPDIKSEFFTKILFWNITVAIHATQGSFRNIRDLRRLNDVIFSHEKHRFEISSTLGLENAVLSFENYYVRFGNLKIRGKVVVNINQILVKSTVAIDFNKNPCKTYLMFFKMYDFGKVNVVMSGLGAVNHQAASIISYLIKKKTLSVIKSGIDYNLSELNCEAFRP